MSAANDLNTTVRPGIDITWVEKYVTYRQDHRGLIYPTDYHFLAETIYQETAQVEGVEAILYKQHAEVPLACYREEDPRAFSNGAYYTRKSKSYDDLASLETAHPPDTRYTWKIMGSARSRMLEPISIGGLQQQTQIPVPGPVVLSQSNRPVTDLNAIDANNTLDISWNPFSLAGGGAPADSIIFVLVSDWNGEVVYTSGAPTAVTEKGYLDYRATCCSVPEKCLDAGVEHIVFISQVNLVDTNVSHGIKQHAANSFAVELAIKTTGATQIPPRQHAKAPYLWSGKTPKDAGLVPWPTFIAAYS